MSPHGLGARAPRASAAHHGFVPSAPRGLVPRELPDAQLGKPVARVTIRSRSELRATRSLRFWMASSSFAATSSPSAGRRA
jgi:hypothetical protein